MRWVVLTALGFIISCSGTSDEGAAPTPFTPPAGGSPAAPLQAAPAAPAPIDPAAPVGDPTTTPSEDPNAGVTAGVDGTASGSAGNPPAATDGTPVAQTPPAEPTTPTEPVAPVDPAAPAISAGCGVGAGVAGEFTLPINGANAAFTITLPPGYDPATPQPLIFAFHGRNQTNIQLRTQDAANIQTEMGGRAVMAYLKSQAGPGWNFPEEVEPNIAFFNAVYDRVMADYCIDTSHVFAVGHSSGGYFANILACRYADRLRGIGAVAGNTQEFDCAGQVAAIIVHGVRDAVVSFAGGQQSRDIYRAQNGCSADSVPFSVSPCIEYQNCDEGFPVAWCEHNEPTYQDTNHGWPSFASQALAQFLFALD